MLEITLIEVNFADIQFIKSTCMKISFTVRQLSNWSLWLDIIQLWLPFTLSGVFSFP